MISSTHIIHYREVTIICENTGLSVSKDGGEMTANWVYKMWGDQTPFLTMKAIQSHIDKQYLNNLEDILNRISGKKRRDCSGSNPSNESSLND